MPRRRSRSKPTWGTTPKRTRLSGRKIAPALRPTLNATGQPGAEARADQRVDALTAREVLPGELEQEPVVLPEAQGAADLERSAVIGAVVEERRAPVELDREPAVVVRAIVAAVAISEPSGPSVRPSAHAALESSESAAAMAPHLWIFIFHPQKRTVPAGRI